jgi:hypothetical protein
MKVDMVDMVDTIIKAVERGFSNVVFRNLIGMSSVFL